MSQINCSGHFIHSCRRMTPPRSQIFLGNDNMIASSKTTTTTATTTSRRTSSASSTARQENNTNQINVLAPSSSSATAKPLSTAQQARRSQLQSAMWTGESNLVSPTTRSKIIKEDNQLLLGGGHRRFAGKSNQSNPNVLFLNPGEKENAPTATNVDIRCLNSSGRASHRGRVAGISSSANSAEFAQTTAGKSAVGAMRPPSAANERKAPGQVGVKKVTDREQDHIENYGYAVRATPTRQRTPPPPLPERKVKTSLRHVESPCRADNCSEPWDRWGEDHSKLSRRQGPKMFPERNQQTFGFSEDKWNSATRAKRSSSSQESGNVTPQRRSSITGFGVGRRTSAASSRSSSVENLLNPRTPTSSKKPQEVKSNTSTTSSVSRTAAARQQSNNNNGTTTSGIPLTGNIINKNRTTSSTNNSTNVSGCLNEGENIRYVPRKKTIVNTTATKPSATPFKC